MNSAWLPSRARTTGMMAVTLTTIIGLGCGDGDPPSGSDAGPPVADAGSMETGDTIVDIAVGLDDFSMLVEAVTAAGLVESLSGEGPFTVFAPTNDAFAASGITDIGAVPVEELEQILLYHVIPADVPASAVTAGTVDSANDLTLFIGTTGGVTLNGGNAVTGGADVVAPDAARASNGVIHVIDRVLLPPNVPMAASYGGLTSLLDAVGASAALPDGTPVAVALSGEGPFTVFAPTNDAFAALTGTPEPTALRDVLLYHVVAGSVDAASVPSRADTLLANEWGHGVTMLFDTSDGVSVNGARVVVADIKTTNGVVHVIDAVLSPPNVVDMAGLAGLGELAAAVGGAADLEDGTSVVAALRAAAPYTVFAPTDDAFSRAPAGLDPATLRDVLLLHVVSADAPVVSSAIPGSARSLLGQELTFDTTAAPPTVAGPGGATGSGAADILATDIHVTNGVIHVIGEVILPAS